MTCLVGHPSIEGYHYNSCYISCRNDETISQTDTSQETPSHRAPLDTTDISLGHTPLS